MAKVMNTVYLNGSFMDAEQARISPMDRGFVFADGVYEVVPAIDGRLFELDGHLQRLERSMSELRIDNPMPRAQWIALSEQMIERNGGGDLSLYMQVTRGAPAKRDHPFPSPPVAPTVFLSTSPLARSPIYQIDTAKGAKAITRDDIRWGRCDIKSVALLANILYRQEAAEAGAAEAILLKDGLLTEGSSTNVFVIKRGKVATPPLSNLILGGITRLAVIAVCAELGIPLEERDINEAELREADEIWVSSSTKDALPIVQLDEVLVGEGRPGPLWTQLARRFLARKQA